MGLGTPMALCMWSGGGGGGGEAVSTPADTVSMARSGASLTLYKGATPFPPLLHVRVGSAEGASL